MNIKIKAELVKFACGDMKRPPDDSFRMVRADYVYDIANTLLDNLMLLDSASVALKASNIILDHRSTTISELKKKVLKLEKALNTKK